MSYMRNSKTSEAKTNLDAIKKGAIVYFEAEHYSADGMSSTTKRYPDNQAGTNALGTTPGTTTVGTKFSPVDYKDELKAKPWKQLNFTIGSPFYYYYDYASDIDASGLSRFQARASASLNEERDSVFYINGYSEGSASAVIDLSEAALNDRTAAAVMPTADPLD